MTGQIGELRLIVDARNGEHRFEIPLEEGTARLEIVRDGGTADFRSTHVPEERRGEGHGARMVEAGLEWAEDLGLKIRPTCPFVQSFLEKHPDRAEEVEAVA